MAKEQAKGSFPDLKALIKPFKTGTDQKAQRSPENLANTVTSGKKIFSK
jgi:hypothetical protein